MKINCNYLFILVILLSNSSFSKEDIKKARWSGLVKAKTVIIKNMYGDVRLRYGGNENVIEYIGVIQNLDEGNSFTITNNTKNKVYSINVNLDKDTPIKKSRVDLTVFIPTEKEVTVITDKGLIEAKGIKSNLTLKSDSGKIKVMKISGLINTENNTGMTSVTLKENIPAGTTQTFKSIYGNISLWISKNSHHDITVSTSGDIISDFSTKITKDRHQEPSKTAKIMLNKAISKLVLYSKRGVVAVREY